MKAGESGRVYSLKGFGGGCDLLLETVNAHF